MEGVAHGEQVVLGLVGIGKARGLAKALRIDIKCTRAQSAPWGVGLVPKRQRRNLVDRGVKHAMERDRKLNDAPGWGQRARRRRRTFEDGVANLVAELREAPARLRTP